MPPYSETAMKKLLLPLCCVLAVSACDDNDNADFVRDAGNIATADITQVINMEVHEQDDDEAAHTHLSLEFFGLDQDGYYYLIQLEDNDELSIALNGESTVVIGEPLPSEDDPYFIDYSEEFETAEAGAEFLVALDRDREASVQTTSLLIPEATVFTLLPADNPLDLQSELTLEWLENEEHSYGVRVHYGCDVINNHPVNFTVHFPNRGAPELISPFSFMPGDYFTPPADVEILGCELTMRLLTFAEEERIGDTDFERVIIQTMRSVSEVRVLNIEAPL